MSVCLLQKLSGKGYISTGMGDHFSILHVSLMALQFTLVDRNRFRPCL